MSDQDSDDIANVTPEMLGAASEVLEGHYLGDGRYDLRREVVAEIYRAMAAKSL
jgi:hypothetical protein